MSTKHSIAGDIALALGKGIIAGLAGTVAITVSQMIEMKLTGREPSDTPADAVEKVLDIEPTTEEKKEKLVQEVHWTYGIMWGLGRSVIDLIGIKGIPAMLTHFGALWGTAMVMLPSIEEAPPVTEWGAKEIAKDGLHHLVYAVAAGAAYDAID